MPLTVEQVKEKASQIKLVIFDVDGILTDGKLAYTAEGETVKHFNVRDGLGIKTLRHHGVEVAVITARQSEPLAVRMKDLGIEYFYPGCRDKAATFATLKAQLGLDNSAIAYVGDDMIDLAVMQVVGLSITASDGYFMVKEQAHWITDAGGGQGVGREVTDLILASQMPMESIYAHLVEAGDYS